MLRRLAVTAATSAAALSFVPAAHADTGPLGLPLLFGKPAAQDHLQIAVSGAGDGRDGTYELECGPVGGNHPQPGDACDRLDQMSASGQDPFAPVPADAQCTMQYGGSATARITGTWHGRPVDATYKRTDGCEISRWQGLVPVLPATGA
ncbi:SSI family serine proteinase inhibitor [Streptomyces sp. NPDC046821]|uniref:SSI family serine proteinase inhibitor n=1 Tax=Streptomyces sp. NPDC046821 TaxID=3154702 RepID=UPI003403A481